MSSIKHSLAWAGYKFTSTVLDDIWPQAFFFTLVATMVCCVSKLTSTNLGINSIGLTVLGTVVSLVVSFKTNNSYLRWWEGRNCWTTITSNSRQMAMILWLQVPNRTKPKDGDDKERKEKDKKGDVKKDEAKDFEMSSPRSPRGWQKKPFAESQDPAAEPLLSYSRDEPLDTLPEEEEDTEKKAKEENRKAEEEKRKAEEEKNKAKDKEMANREREELEGLIEKKTYINLAFSVALKHSLRGEKGPFYSDLYSLIAFLPKYNASACLPITKDELLVLWTNGIPRQKWHSQDDVTAVPLTQAAAFDGYAFEQLDANEKPAEEAEDKEKVPDLTTTSPAFREQAVRAAAKYVNSDDPDVVGFANLSRRSHRLRRDGSPQSENEQVTIASVELMPPRHPPMARFWDFFPPLRFIKIVIDWFKTRERLEEQERTRGGKRRRAGGTTMKSEIPQEILMYLSAYINELADRGDMNSSFIGPLMTATMELQKAMSDLDKVATTPIPSAYSFHLRLSIFLYLFLLPFQMYNYIGWITVPAVAVASIIYLGFLEIGAQIEMPFGYDQSDLDLDRFVLKISQQLAEVTAFPSSVSARHIIQSHLNQPFLPSLALSVPELLGTPEPVTIPTALGFAAAYPETKTEKDEQGSKAATEAHEAAMAKKATAPRPKTLRDLELAMNANWREIGDETKKVLGRNRDHLENKTGMEIAVMAL